jgi:hypothetical protein
MEKYNFDIFEKEIYFLKKKNRFVNVETDPWHGNWKYTISSESHLEKLTVLFCHIFSSRAIFPCVLSIGDKHKGNFLKSSLRWG